MIQLKRRQKILLGIGVGGILLVLVGNLLISSPKVKRFFGRERNVPVTNTQPETPTEPSPPPEDEPEAMSDTLFPRLHAILFRALSDTPACHEALASYDILRTGTVDSGNEAALTAAKKINPNLPIFTHMSLRYVEANWFGYSKDHPRRVIIERVSPRHFAYPRLIRLQEDVKNASEDTFEFTAQDIKYLRSLGVKGMDEGELDRWVKKAEYEPYYFQFFDNDAGGKAGTSEIMAIQKLWTDGDKGFIQMTHKRQTGGGETRTVFGSAQNYSKGARGSVLSSTNAELGALVFLLNLECMNSGSAFCKEVNTAGSFIDIAVEYVGKTQMTKKKDGIFLVDGTTLDADDEDGLKAYSYRFAGATSGDYKLDMDGNGSVDDINAINHDLPAMYAEYARLVEEEARAQSRPGFFVVVNGRLAETVDSKAWPHPHIDGREFEDLNGGFNEPNTQVALDQYQNLFTGLVSNPAPLVTVSSRDRKATDAGHFNLREHRATMAATLVLGDGYYGAMGSYASSIPECFTTKEPATWMDEYRVDGKLHWLGRATGSAVTLDEKSETYSRTFENGIAIFSGKGGTFRLPKAYNRICGTDPANNCAKGVTEVTLEAFDGLILAR